MTAMLTPDEVRDMIRGFHDHQKFCAHLSIRNKDGVTVPYRMSPGAIKLNRSIRKQEIAGIPVRQCVLKASQVYMSSAACTEIFRRVPFFPGRRALVLADTDAHAGLVFEYFTQYMQSYQDNHYGSEWGALILLPEMIKDTERHIRWANGSSVLVGTAYNVDIARSAPFNWLLFSEAAFYRDMSALMTGAMQRVPNSPDSGVIVESTANGMGGPFYDLCQRAMDPRRDSGWAFVFFAWWEHPEYRLDPGSSFRITREELAELQKYNLTVPQIAWRRRQIETACEGKIERFRQEFPACVTAETRVSTDRGLVPICEAIDCKETESGHIVAAGPQPMSTIYRLETTCGRELRGTLDHPIAMPDGRFMCLSKLQPGQKIQLRAPRFAEFAYEIRWRPIPGAECSVVVGREWGILLGLFMGDGSWHADTFEIACDGKDEDVIELTRQTMSNLIGIPHATTIIRVKGRKGCVRLRVGSKPAREVFLRLGAIRQQTNLSCIRNICVPEAIFRSPQIVVRGFLQGLFESDGSASGNCVRFASSKLGFVRDVQLLLLGFGINSRISANHKKAGDDGHSYSCWVLRLGVEAARVFHDEIGFLSIRKSTHRHHPYNGKISKAGKRYGAPPTPNDMTDEVERVTKEETSEVTYDLTVEPDHVFSANGILTHNTASEAFQSSGRTIFDMQAISRMPIIHDGTRGRLEVIDVGLEKRVQFVQSSDGRGELVIYRMPKKGGHYVIGADHAEGIDPLAKEKGAGGSDPDYSSATVMDADTGEQVAALKERYEPHPWADRLFWLGRYYNWAFIAPEAKAVGKAVIGHLLELQYPLELIYSKQRAPSDRRSPMLQELGFDTNNVFRPILISNLDMALRQNAIAVHDPETIAELQQFVRKANGREEGVTHDDTVFSLALCVEGLPYARRAFTYRESLDKDVSMWKPQRYGPYAQPVVEDD